MTREGNEFSDGAKEVSSDPFLIRARFIREKFISTLIEVTG